jgi:hypothetical protein
MIPGVVIGERAAEEIKAEHRLVESAQWRFAPSKPISIAGFEISILNLWCGCRL